MDFQEELSDMLLLKMLQAATRGSADKDKVRAYSTEPEKSDILEPIPISVNKKFQYQFVVDTHSHGFLNRDLNGGII